MVHQAVVTSLSQIDEADFRGFSSGCRLGRSPHQALDALSVALTRKGVDDVLDCDIRGFLDHASCGLLHTLTAEDPTHERERRQYRP